ncbi:LysR substrate-binding domain-containing protein [Enterobacter cloacae complex sp. 2024EL-00229]|uniref:LysR substrate-binding domain-containing protein n=1 Tax=Enterobacter cloacae complex sp. 2024EL-00229 TaxID=3374273 RepID=UPI0037504B32
MQFFTRVKASKLDFQNQPVDIAIYYGNEKHPDFYQVRLFEEFLIPVCTPEYAERFCLLESDSHLKEVTFLHCTESLEFLSPLNEWQHWLIATNRNPNILKHKYVFNHEELTMVAARNCMGVALGRYHLIKPYIESGELVALFERVSSGFGYDLICRKSDVTRPKIQAFLKWINEMI